MFFCTSFLHFSSHAHPQLSLFPTANDVQTVETITIPSLTFSRMYWSWQCMMRILLLQMTISSVCSLIQLNFQLKEQCSCLLSPAHRWEGRKKKKKGQLRNLWILREHFQNLGVNLPWMTYPIMDTWIAIQNRKYSEKSGFESLSLSSQYCYELLNSIWPKQCSMKGRDLTVSYL